MDPSVEKREEKMRNVMKPDWYRVLMKETFRGNCRIHPSEKRDVFCLFCHLVVCSECIVLHRLHPFIQVTNVLDHDAVGLDRVSMFVDCSQIQTHEIDGKKLIALNPKHAVKSAEECKKLVQGHFDFCSLSCKVDHVLDRDGDFSSICEIQEFGLLSSEGHYTVLNSDSDLNDQNMPGTRFAGTSRISDQPVGVNEHDAPTHRSASTSPSPAQLVGSKDDNTPDPHSAGKSRSKDHFVDDNYDGVPGQRSVSDSRSTDQSGGARDQNTHDQHSFGAGQPVGANDHIAPDSGLAGTSELRTKDKLSEFGEQNISSPFAIQTTDPSDQDDPIFGPVDAIQNSDQLGRSRGQNVTNQNRGSFRKRPRKGTPTRSPLS